MADYSDAYLTDKELAVKYSRPATLNATSTAQEWAAWFAAERDYYYQQWLNWQAITLDISTKVGHLEAEVKRLTPREITSVEELDALQVGAVVRSALGDTFERERIGWSEIGFTWNPSSEENELPATVLYTPEVQS